MTEDLCPSGCVGYCRMLREYRAHWERATPQTSDTPVLTVDRERCNMRWRFARHADVAPKRPILRRPA